MSNITIKSLHIENFKGVKNFDIKFENRTSIKGRNASGKTSLLDAYNWCLFNTDSQGNTKFEIRPLDSEGNKIHDIEIKVVLVLNVNGKDIEFTKVQKENWVKHKGNEKATLEGNPNSYEIDGYPKKKRTITHLSLRLSARKH